MTCSDPSATIQGQIWAIYASLQYLWLLIEHRGRIPVAEHSEIRAYCLAVLQSLRAVQEKHASTEDDWRDLAQMLANVQFISLVGRVLLLALDEGNEFQNTEELDAILEELSSFKDVFNGSVIAAPELFTDSKIEWAKVLAQLGFWVETRPTSLKQKGRERDRSLNMVKTWSRYAAALKDDYHAPQLCAYPRCAQPFTREKGLRVRYTCGQCNSAAYCDLSCQRAHWQIPTSESHRLECVPSGDRLLRTTQQWVSLSDYLKRK
ncbi:hypothetical protein FRC08_003029 [Ceratobasidium sp. 394]|nr:hypothetical protein FRC08_003029 [Ceratobasidium sp. 394]